MAGIKFTNFAHSTLAVGISYSDTLLSVGAGHGARFPAIGVGEYFYVTLEDASVNREIVKVTAVSTDAFTIERAQDGTTALAWLPGDTVALRLNAAAVADVVGEAVTAAISTEALVYIAGPQTITGAKTFSSQIVASGGVAGNADTVTNGVYTTGAQTITGSKRGSVTTDNDLSFDMNAGNNFACTTAGSGTLTFTNITAGQSGFIKLVNASNHTISAATNTKISAADLAKVSVSGTYIISYFSDGTDVFCVVGGTFA